MPESTNVAAPSYKLAILHSGGKAPGPRRSGTLPELRFKYQLNAAIWRLRRAQRSGDSTPSWGWVPLPTDELGIVKVLAHQIRDFKLTLGYRIVQIKIDAGTGDVHTNIFEQWLKDEKVA